MVLSESLKLENILINPLSNDRWGMIKEIVALLVKTNTISADQESSTVAALTEREKKMSTGIGKGVAIPHCTIENLDDIRIALAVNEKGINFQAIDDEPVKVIIMLLVPKSKLSQHIKTLANIAKFMNNDDLKNTLISMKNPEDILKLFQDNCK